MRENSMDVLYYEGYRRALIDAALWFEKAGANLRYERVSIVQTSDILSLFFQEADSLMRYGSELDVYMTKDAKMRRWKFSATDFAKEDVDDSH